MAVQTGNTTEYLLNAVAQMPENEFNQFVEKAREIRTQRKPLAENDLIHKINTIYSAEKRQRFNQLNEKFQQESLTPKEYEELLKLNDEFEILNAKKLEYLGEIAIMRGESFDNVVKEFRVKL